MPLLIIGGILLLLLVLIFSPARSLMNILILLSFIAAAFGWFGLFVVGTGTYANNYLLWAIGGTIAWIGLLVVKSRVLN